MSQRSWDPSGEASAALRSAVDSHGARVLSNPQMLSNLFKDLLPDWPREAFVLVTAAEADVAGMLQQRVEQRLDPDSAVRLTATSLSDQCPIDPSASVWAATAFADALGIAPLVQPRAARPVPTPIAPPVPPPAPPRTAAPAQSWQQPHRASTTTIPRPPDRPPVVRPRRRRRPGALGVVIGLVAVATVAVIALLLVGPRHHGTPLTTASAGSTAPPTSVAPVTVPEARLVYEDKFTDAASGWTPDAGQGDGGVAAYVGGSYQVTALKSNPVLNTFSVRSPYEPRLMSMAVVADITVVNGQPADGAGVRCDQGSRNGLRYSFETHRDGTWVIFQLGGQGPPALLQGSSPAIQQGSGKNSVSGQCTEINSGSTRLTMKVNGVVVGTVDYAHGGSPIGWHGAGVIYRSVGSPATVVRFNDFRTYDIHAS